MINFKILAVIGVFVLGLLTWTAWLNSNLKDCRLEVASMKVHIINQNESIKRAKRESDVLTEKGKVIVKEADVAAQVFVDKAAKIRKSVPLIPSDDCKSSLILGNS